MTDLTISILRRAKFLIEKGGFAQGAMEQNGAHCMIGALLHVARAASNGESIFSGMETFYAALHAVKCAIERPCIATWNDKPGRTKEEVLNALMQAEKFIP